MGEPGRDEERSARKRRRSMDGSVDSLTPLLEAACGELHAALVYNTGRDHARHYPLARVLPFL
jgi:hypothetical protein